MRNARVALMIGMVSLTVAMTGSGVAGARNDDDSAHHDGIAADASGLRAAIHPDGVTRLVIDLSQSIAFKTRLLADPMRIVIDSDDLEWKAKPTLARSVGPFVGVTYAQDVHGGHLTLRLGRPSDVKSAFIIPPRETTEWRLVMDVKDTTRHDFLAQAETPQIQQGQTQKPLSQQTEPEYQRVVSAPPPIQERGQERAPERMPPERMIVVTSPAMAQKIADPTPPPIPVGTPALTVTAPPVITASMVKGGSSLSAPMPPPLPTTPVLTPVAKTTPTSADEMAQQNPNLALAQLHLPIDRDDGDRANNRDNKHDGRPVIVIDPGHGGMDPGATSVSGVYEKTITFGMAHELQRQLEKTGHYRVYLTRDRDVFIRLRDRIAISRRYNADLFISLHADVVKDADIHGLSVYTLSQDSSDVEAQSLADKENKADLIAGIDLSHESSDVTNILIDLAQRETMNRSAGFAGTVVEELAREIPLLANTHRFAGFAVLKAPDVPAVLIEMGYLSNTVDERNLRQPDYRSKLARSITRAVDRYFLQGQKAKRS